MEQRGNRALSRMLLIGGLALLGATTALFLLIAARLATGADYLARQYFVTQDLLLVGLVALAWLALAMIARRERAALWPQPPRMVGPILVLLAAAVAWFGRHLVLLDYDKSRDEQMAAFDALVFQSGRLAAPVPPEWRERLEALNHLFMFPIGQNEAWVSAYLPVNAAFRALFGLIGDANLTGPFFVLLGGWALAAVARKLWPGEPSVPLLCVLLYVGSGQILMSGMSAYAMTGHLALNLLWLWLFLADRRGTDVAALLIGFLATGLHQPLFHPMFAAPLLFLVVVRRQWLRAGLFLLGYSAIGAFWLGWPLFIDSLATTPVPARPMQVDYLSRLSATVTGFGGDNLLTMAFNLLRFVGWQHLLLVPLLLLGGLAVVRACNPLGIALLVSLLLPVLVMAIILPIQGLGWGYRYLHPMLGNAILLAGFAFAPIAARGQGRGLLGWATAGTAALLMPLQFKLAHDFQQPHAALDRAIANSRADFAFIDASSVAAGGDLVTNRPYLDNRPLRLDPMALSSAQIDRLCASRPTVAAFGFSDLDDIRAVVGIDWRHRGALMEARLAQAQRAGCRIVKPVGR